LVTLVARPPPLTQEAEEEVFEMIGEIDTKGTGDIGMEDFVRLLCFDLEELPGETIY
jgi:hypothetical protein